MPAVPPTVEQLLVLADRAERGPLTAPEASRLRQGIQRLAVPPVTRPRRPKPQRAVRQLAAVAALIHRTQARGARTVPVWALERILRPQPTSNADRQQREAA